MFCGVWRAVVSCYRSIFVFRVMFCLMWPRNSSSFRHELGNLKTESNTGRTTVPYVDIKDDPYAFPLPPAKPGMMARVRTSSTGRIPSPTPVVAVDHSPGLGGRIKAV
jgi:hypothetical protein